MIKRNKRFVFRSILYLPMIHVSCGWGRIKGLLSVAIAAFLTATALSALGWISRWTRKTAAISSSQPRSEYDYSVPKVVDVKGVGRIAFPETMPDHEIAGHIGEHLGLKREDRIRGSADLPLTKDGKANAAAMGRLFQQAFGGFDRIATSPQKRTFDSARLLSPKAWIRIDANLEDINYGSLEGQKSKDAIPQVNNYIRNAPDTPFAGVSNYSGLPGESFNHYKGRMIPAVVSVIQVSMQNPKERILMVMNRRTMKTFMAWIKAGANNDLSVDCEEATSFESGDVKNGSIWRVTGNGLGPVQSVDQIGPGLYSIRHFETHWNS